MENPINDATQERVAHARNRKNIMQNKIKELQNKRFLFLKKVYEATNGDYLTSVKSWEIGNELGFSASETDQIDDFLSNEGLIEHIAFGGTIVITHKGVVQIESALSSNVNSNNGNIGIGGSAIDSNIVSGNNNIVINIKQSKEK